MATGNAVRCLRLFASSFACQALRPQPFAVVMKRLLSAQMLAHRLLRIGSPFGFSGFALIRGQGRALAGNVNCHLGSNARNWKELHRTVEEPTRSSRSR